MGCEKTWYVSLPEEKPHQNVWALPQTLFLCHMAVNVLGRRCFLQGKSAVVSPEWICCKTTSADSREDGQAAVRIGDMVIITAQQPHLP